MEAFAIKCWFAIGIVLCIVVCIVGWRVARATVMYIVKWLTRMIAKDNAQQTKPDDQKRELEEVKRKLEK